MRSLANVTERSMKEKKFRSFQLGEVFFSFFQFMYSKKRREGNIIE